MERPTEQQVQDAMKIVEAYQRTYGLASAENNKRRMIFSVLAACGGIGTVAAEYASLIGKHDGKTPQTTPAINPDKIAAKAAADQKPEPADATDLTWLAVHPSEDENTASTIEVMDDNDFGFEIGTIFAQDMGDEAWFMVTVDEDTGEAHIEITGDNEYEMPEGLVFTTAETNPVDDEDEDTDDGDLPSELELESMGFEPLKAQAKKEGADIAGLNSKADVRKAILDKRTAVANAAKQSKD